MSFGFFSREAIRALTRNAVPSFAAMATVLVTVLVLGVFIPVVQATTGAANDVRAKVIADVYLKTNASPQDIERVRHIVTTETPHVKRVVYVSKEQAYREESAKRKRALQPARLQPAAADVPRLSRQPGQHRRRAQRARAGRRRPAGAR